ncbi:MAG: NlpC/P60 family protein [Paludibacter sp.]|nr:NlpC/P60 family protein [Paludibacter sp.]
MQNKNLIESFLRKTEMLLSAVIILLIPACSYNTKDAVPIENTFGIINISVANLYSKPAYASETTTQLLLGAPIQALQHEGNWYKVKTTEGYIAWIPGNVFVKLDSAAYAEYVRTEKKIIFTDDYGFAYELPDTQQQRASDLVFGSILKWEEDISHFYKVSFPDGRKAFVLKNQTENFDNWLSTRQMNIENVVKTALSLKGIPYMWGGTSVRALDCSGFTKTVFQKQGVILLRDASEQATTGIPVDISKGYDDLQTGDLMFFGRKATKNRKEGIRHVAIYLGNKQFIQAVGYIRISSLDPESPVYDEKNTRGFIRATRIIGAEGTNGIKSMADYYNID